MYDLTMSNKIDIEYAWFRPARDEIKKIPKELVQHILDGGLMVDNLVLAIDKCKHEPKSHTEILLSKDPHKILQLIRRFYNDFNPDPEP